MFLLKIKTVPSFCSNRMTIQPPKEYPKKIFAEGIPATMFGVADVRKEYKRLMEHGVKTMEPTEMGEVTIAVFDDTCGNLIQIVQK